MAKVQSIQWYTFSANMVLGWVFINFRFRGRIKRNCIELGWWLVIGNINLDVIGRHYNIGNIDSDDINVRNEGCLLRELSDTIRVIERLEVMSQKFVK
jgi:hypothetical protein